MPTLGNDDAIECEYYANHMLLNTILGKNLDEVWDHFKELPGVIPGC